MATSSADFNAIKITLASPVKIQEWSFGEVTKPETINYRTLRPERDGLFCERIFGPTKDWECACGKYKKIRFKGIKCERCGVEVTRAKVRRERMGHIDLAAPVAHIWFSKGIPSRLGLLLDLSPRNLERVLYFAQYIITDVDEAGRDEEIARIEEMAKDNLQRLEDDRANKLQQAREQAAASRDEALAPFAERDAGIHERELDLAAREVALAERDAPADDDADATALRSELDELRTALDADKAALNAERAGAAEPVDLWLAEQEAVIEKSFVTNRDTVEDLANRELDDLRDLQPMKLLLEARQRDLSDKHPTLFKSGMGAEAILTILREQFSEEKLEEMRDTLMESMRSSSGQRRKKAVKRLRLVEAFRKSGNKPEWMVLTKLPVLPPDLRPMVQLDGGRFATSDLNDLYRRVINRNNRLRRLLELEAPEIIIRNEKRMLQEAVDALIDNGRRGRAISGSHNHKLKSLSDLLRGKQGRFRQNLLGKRVDYSGRSVIVVGPTLQLYQCGLPKRMALELFKPFVMHRLVLQGLAHNIKSAKRAVERVRPEVWDVLEEVIKDRPVLMNRAPTLHRLGIQAFMPVLIEGSAPQLHPLVCTAFNADFDGDQMAIHVPLSRRAVQEARRVMLSIYNMLSPASGEPVVAPTLDIVLGCYFLTMENVNAQGAGKRFSSAEEAHMAHQMGLINIQAPIQVLQAGAAGEASAWLDTTVGRLTFRELLPEAAAEDPENWNRLMDKGALKTLVTNAYHMLGNEETADMLDKVKNAGFHYATVSGITIGISDLEVPDQKSGVLSEAETHIQELEEQYQMGLITERERYEQTINIWTDASARVTNLIEEALPSYGGVYLMATSGAKGNISQIKQMAGMRGLMSDPKGFLIPLPVKSSFREGLSVLEYFISTHGARKGLADTALRTADSGYLTRRMVDVAQDVIILSENCETLAGIWVRHDYEKERANAIAPFADRLVGRVVCAPIADPATGEVLADRDEIIDAELAQRLGSAGVVEAYVRSPLACEAPRGICRMCYGIMPATGKMVNLGDAAGIIAAQSIGEPGTQLTMRTFHTGGIAGVDITSGIPRVEELFEARIPKNHAILSQIDGAAEVEEDVNGKHIRIVSSETYHEDMDIEDTHKVVVKNGAQVESGAVLAEPKKRAADKDASLEPVYARVPGSVSLTKGRITISWEEPEERSYTAPPTAHVVVKTGDQVRAGQELTAGQKNPHDILLIQGRDAVHDYIIEEVQKVYRFQGVSMHDKHIEIVIRQMMRKVRVDQQGDTDLLPGEPVDRAIFDEANRRVLAEGGEPARATPMLLGITRASLGTESFLAAASFQETTRVLTEAAISGSVDQLSGLKENVIIGRLIPARMDMTEEGRERLGILAEEEEARAMAAALALEDARADAGIEDYAALLTMNPANNEPIDLAFDDD